MMYAAAAKHAGRRTLRVLGVSILAAPTLLVLHAIVGRVVSHDRGPTSHGVSLYSSIVEQDVRRTCWLWRYATGYGVRLQNARFAATADGLPVDVQALPRATDVRPGAGAGILACVAAPPASYLRLRGTATFSDGDYTRHVKIGEVAWRAQAPQDEVSP